MPIGLIDRTVNGWNPWHSVKSIRGGIPVPSAEFPPRYTPSRSFWAEAYSVHCDLPGSGGAPFDPFSTFYFAGGASGTLIGTVSGLGAVAQAFSNQIGVVDTWAIGAENPPMVMGYCIGDAYKEFVYLYLSNRHLGASEGLSSFNSYIDVFQRSKLKRMYLSYGSITRYDITGFGDNKSHILTLDVSGIKENIRSLANYVADSMDTPSIGTTTKKDISNPIFINIIKRGSTETKKLKVISILSGYRVVVEDPKDFSINPDDIYQIDKVIYLQDPFLLSGYFFGNEDDGVVNAPRSGKNLTITSDNRFYDEFVFTGVYVFKDLTNLFIWQDLQEKESKAKEELDNSIKKHNDTGEESDLAIVEQKRLIFEQLQKETEAAKETWENNLNVISVAPGSSFSDVGNQMWVWVKSDDYSQSEVYKDEPNRYRENTSVVTTEILPKGIDDPNGPGIETHSVNQRPNGTEKDVSDWIESGAIYLRVEISKGGDFKRNNWHSPALKKSLLKQIIKDKSIYFDILGQPDGNVIDVALIDVTGQYSLDISSGASIFNQYGWFITEHFMGNDQTGIFGGKGEFFENVGNGKITMSIPQSPPTRGTILPNTKLFNPVFTSSKDGGNSFYNRFINAHVKIDNAIFAWDKFDGWCVTNNKGDYFEIFSVVRMDNSKLFLVLPEGAKILDGQDIWVTFDAPYKRITSSPKTALYFWDFSKGIKEQVVNDVLIGNVDTICADISLVGTPIVVDVPQNTVVGVCDGFGWGYGDTASVLSRYSLPLLVTTESSSLGLSSFYSLLNQDNWVAYRDIYTNRLTVRTGTLGFREAPQKIEISVGFPQDRKTYDGFPITLDTTYDRCKMLSMKVPSSNNGACTFQIGTENDYHGFLVNGGGEVDFQALRRSGIGAGNVSSETFQYKGYDCSPCYIYHQNEVNLLSNKMLFIGASTEEGTLYVKNGEPENIIVEYVDESQTIENTGFFDIHRLFDGENILIYSQKVPPFNVVSVSNSSSLVVKADEFLSETVSINEQIIVPNSSSNASSSTTTDPLNNSPKNDTQWNYQKGIFITGTSDQGILWGCPIVKKLNFDNNDKYQWPLLILNGVEYQTSIYNKFSNSLCIFYKSFSIRKPYIGCMIVHMLNIPYQLDLCEPVSQTSSNFLWRSPVLGNDLSAWTDTENIPSIDSQTDAKYNDVFIRIIGLNGTDSQLTSTSDDWGFINSVIWVDGSYFLFYDDAEGVKLLFSRDQGLTWQQSKIILARNSTAGLLINDSQFFYITPYGIECKVLGTEQFNNAMACVEGNSLSFIEEVQRLFDSPITVKLGSGQIRPQGLSGYEDMSGVARIFYYDNDGLLSCLMSGDYLRWFVAPNF